MKTSTVRLFILICGATLLSLPLNAGSLYMISFGDAGFTNLPPSAVSYPGSTVLTPTQTLTGQSGAGNRGYTESYSSYLSFGHLGLSISGSDYCLATTCGEEFQPDALSDFSQDSVSISGVTNGTLRLQYLFDGTLASSGANASTSAVWSIQNGIGSYAASVGASTSPSGTSTIGGTLTAAGANTFDYLATGFADIVISNGSAPIAQRLDGAANCSSFSGQTCSASINFLNSALIGNAVVLDSNGNIVAGAIITSASGYDYTRQLPQTAPEPASWLLFSTGLAAFAAIRKIRSQTAARAQ